MSLVVKCQCGMILKYDIRNPGLIVVKPCEDCLQRQEDQAMYTVGAGVSAVNDAVAPGQLDSASGPADAQLEDYAARMKQTKKSKHVGTLISGGDDDNDPKNPIDRRLS